MLVTDVWDENFWRKLYMLGTGYSHFGHQLSIYRYHQDRNSFTNIQKLSPTLNHQHLDVTNITVTKEAIRTKKRSQTAYENEKWISIFKIMNLVFEKVAFLRIPQKSTHHRFHYYNWKSLKNTWKKPCVTYFGIQKHLFYYFLYNIRLVH